MTSVSASRVMRSRRRPAVLCPLVAGSRRLATCCARRIKRLPSPPRSAATRGACRRVGARSDAGDRTADAADAAPAGEQAGQAGTATPAGRRPLRRGDDAPARMRPTTTRATPNGRRRKGCRPSISSRPRRCAPISTSRFRSTSDTSIAAHRHHEETTDRPNSCSRSSSLLFIVISVQTVYATIIRPHGRSHPRGRPASGCRRTRTTCRSVSPFVIVKDPEQEICFILTFWAITIMVLKACGVAPRPHSCSATTCCTCPTA